MARKLPVLELFDHHPRCLLAFKHAEATEKREAELWLRRPDGQSVKYMWINTIHDRHKLEGYEFCGVHFHGTFEDVIIHLALSRVR